MHPSTTAGSSAVLPVDDVAAREAEPTWVSCAWTTTAPRKCVAVDWDPEAGLGQPADVSPQRNPLFRLVPYKGRWNGGTTKCCGSEKIWIGVFTAVSMTTSCRTGSPKRRNGARREGSRPASGLDLEALQMPSISGAISVKIRCKVIARRALSVQFGPCESCFQSRALRKWTRVNSDKSTLVAANRRVTRQVAGSREPRSK